ncbi:hypothetical protein ATANTOWER_017129 [Ataeniobius toweri]|uniref:Uncharacterized protein n=1 Tax=Ataeniobius toweri TaxID=208326 RepID=A0ABU7BT87_9TELE|nr:hypothetical protein [Ataeniobius toweri]
MSPRSSPRSLVPMRRLNTIEEQGSLGEPPAALYTLWNHLLEKTAWVRGFQARVSEDVKQQLLHRRDAAQIELLKMKTMLSLKIKQEVRNSVHLLEAGSLKTGILEQMRLKIHSLDSHHRGPSTHGEHDLLTH